MILIPMVKFLARSLGLCDKKYRKAQFSYIFFVGALLLTACSTTNNINNESTSPPIIIEKNADANNNVTTTPLIPRNDNILSESEMLMLRSEVLLTEESIVSLLDLLSNMEVYYQHSDLFEIEAALRQYRSMNLVSPFSEEIIRNNYVDASHLYDIVLKNNEEFKIEKPHRNVEDISNNVFRNIVDIIAIIVNEKLNSDAEIDIYILDNTLKNLCIFELGGFQTAAVEHKIPLLSVNFPNLEYHQQQNPDKDMLGNIVRHEGVHLMQIDYINNDQWDLNSGVSYSYRNLIINTLWWDWFTEGAAEKLHLRVGESPFVYHGQINDIEALSLTVIMNDNVTPTSIEELTLQRDLNKVFEIFGSSSEQEKEEIIKMMYAFELLHNRSREFSNNYKEKNNSDFTISDFDKYALQLRPAISQTLSKIFYINLSTSLLDNSMTLKEIFTVINAFEIEMNRFTRYDSEGRADSNAEFINNYIEIQNGFFNCISQNLDMKPEDIKTMLIHFNNTYFSSPEQSDILLEIVSLSESKNDFLIYMINSRLEILTHSYTERKTDNINR